jgi:hypothetical protein
VDAEPDFQGTNMVRRTMLKETQDLNHGSAICKKKTQKPSDLIEDINKYFH